MTIKGGAGPTDTELEAALAWVWAQGGETVTDHKCALSALLEWYERYRPLVAALLVEGDYLRLPARYVQEICDDNQRLYGESGQLRRELAHCQKMRGRQSDHIRSDPQLADSLVDFIERTVVNKEP